MRTLLRLLAAAAITGPGLAGPSPLTAQAQRMSRSSDVITREEIERARLEDAYQVVLRLRPEFLHRTGHPRARSQMAGDQSSDDTDGSRSQGLSADPYAPEFDQERSGNGVGERADGPVGFAGGRGSAGPSSIAATPVDGGRDTVLVYVGNAVAGGIEELTTIPASAVQEIRWLRPADAQFRFGSRHSGAVILLTLQH